MKEKVQDTIIGQTPKSNADSPNGMDSKSPEMAIEALNGMGSFICYNQPEVIDFLFANTENQAFSDHLTESASDQEWLCLQDISQYEKANNMEERRVIAEQIFKTYLTAGPDELNVTENLRGPIRSALQSGKPLEDSMFDDLKKAAKMDLMQSAYFDFKNKPQFLEIAGAYGLTRKSKETYAEFLKQDTPESKQLAINISDLNTQCKTMLDTAEKNGYTPKPSDIEALAIFQRNIVDASHIYLTEPLPNEQNLKKRCNNAFETLQKSLSPEMQETPSLKMAESSTPEMQETPSLKMAESILPS